jgi:hypothetical protein
MSQWGLAVESFMALLTVELVKQINEAFFFSGASLHFAVGPRRLHALQLAGSAV